MWLALVFSKITMVWLIISPNEVFGDIMVLASSPRLPIDPDDVNTRKVFTDLFKFYMMVDTPWGTLLLTWLKFDTLRGLQQLCSQPNDTRIPQIFKMQYLHN